LHVSHSDEDHSKITPQQVDSEVGKEVLFTCDSKGNTKWFHNTLKKEPILEKELLHLRNLGGEEDGYYYCYGTNIQGDPFLAMAVLNVFGMYRCYYL